MDWWLRAFGFHHNILQREKDDNKIHTSSCQCFQLTWMCIWQLISWVWKWQCGNFSSFLSHRFYVKSIFEILEVLKMQLFCIFGDWILIFWSISAFKKCKNSWKLKFRSSKCVKMADFAFLETQNLISRKICDRKIMKFSTLWKCIQEIFEKCIKIQNKLATLILVLTHK